MVRLANDMLADSLNAFMKGDAAGWAVHSADAVRFQFPLIVLAKFVAVARRDQGHIRGKAA